MYVLVMAATDKRSDGGYERLTVSDGLATRFGRIELAGEVNDAEPILVRRLRVLDGLTVSAVSHGRGRYRAVDGTMVPIVGPMVTVVLPGEPHWYGTDPGQRWTEWFAVVHGPIFAMLVADDPPFRSGPRPLPPGVRIDDLAQLLRHRPHPTAADEQVWALARWLAEALRRPADDDGARWDRARTLLTEDFRVVPSITEVAATVGLGYEAFRHGFRRHFGQAPLAYRNERRLELAATLLRLTSLSCREIADRLGYTDEFHLSRRFKARFAVSPTAYRADLRG